MLRRLNNVNTQQMILSYGILSKNFCVYQPQRSYTKTLIKHIGRQSCGDKEQLLIIEGWIKTLRKHKQFSFIEISDGSSINPHKHLQAVLKTENTEGLNTGCAVRLFGTLVRSPGVEQSMELLVDKVEIIGKCEQSTYPFAKKYHTEEHIRENLHLRLRTNNHMAIAKTRNLAFAAFHEYFQKNDYLYFTTPIITGNDCEGGGQTFQLATVSDNQRENSLFFNQESFLTVSGQLHLETACYSMKKAYTFGPCFRAEKHHTRKHLAEFWMLEAELAFIDSISILIEEIRSCLLYVINNVITNGKDFVENIASLQTVANQEWPIIEYKEAIEILQKGQSDFASLSLGDDIQTMHERYLTNHHFHSPIFIKNYPGKLKPFYMKENENDVQDLANNNTVACFDLIFPEYGEISGGSLREHRYENLHQKLTTSNFSKFQNQNILDWYLNLRKYGSQPHGGFGIGFERFLQFLTNSPNIRDVIPFPRVEGSIRF